jgi:hypothetical protein
VSRRWRLLVLLALVLSSGALAYMARAYPSFAWDGPIAEWVQGLQAPGLKRAMHVVSLPGTAVGALVSVVAAGALVLWRAGWRAAIVVLAVVFLDAANEALKALIGRPRPGAAGGMEADSFPSGHVFHTVSFSACCGLSWRPTSAPAPSGSPPGGSWSSWGVWSVSPGPTWGATGQATSLAGTWWAAWRSGRSCGWLAA